METATHTQVLMGIELEITRLKHQTMDLVKQSTQDLKAVSTTSMNLAEKFMYLNIKTINFGGLCIAALLISGCAESINNSWSRISGNSSFEESNSYCKKMDLNASTETELALKDILMIGAASSAKGKYSGMQNQASLTGYEKGVGARQPNPAGLPYADCMNSFGWAALTKIAKSNVMDGYVDLATISRVGSNRTVWTIFDFKTTQEFNKEMVLSSRQQQEFDCSQRRSRYISAEGYKNHMAKGQILATDTALTRWEDIRANSMDDAVIKEVCNR